MGIASARTDDPLFALREYRQLAPWSLRDLSTLAGAILDASGVRPINAAASEHPSERTIRFYVTRSLVAPPQGRGTAATYSYRHLLEVLAIKLRQMEGTTLADIGKELSDSTGDVLERRVAAALGSGLPTPNELPLTSQDAPQRGRAGQALRTWLGVPEEPAADSADSHTWHRIPVSDGVELHVWEGTTGPLKGRENEIADAVRLTLARVLSRARSLPGTTRPAAKPVERSVSRSWHE